MGRLKAQGLFIPSKLHGWVESRLADEVVQELGKLVGRLRAATPKVKNRATPRDPSSIKGDNGKPVVKLLEPDKETLLLEQLGGPSLLIRLPDHTDISDDTTALEPAAVPDSTDPDSALVDLTSFPIPARASLWRHFGDLLRTERTHALRSAMSTHADFALTAHLQPLIGTPPSHVTPDGSGLAGRLIALSCFGAGEGGRGGLAIPAMIALLRWRLYTGAGWEAGVPV